SNWNRGANRLQVRFDPFFARLVRHDSFARVITEEHVFFRKLRDDVRYACGDIRVLRSCAQRLIQQKHPEARDRFVIAIFSMIRNKTLQAGSHASECIVEGKSGQVPASHGHMSGMSELVEAEGAVLEFRDDADHLSFGKSTFGGHSHTPSAQKK